MKDGAAGRLVDATALDPENRFSTMSILPTPCLPPMRLSRVSNPTGRGITSTATGVPCSKPMVTTSRPVRARSGSAVMWNIPAGGASQVLEDSPS